MWIGRLIFYSVNINNSLNHLCGYYYYYYY